MHGTAGHVKDHIRGSCVVSRAKSAWSFAGRRKFSALLRQEPALNWKVGGCVQSWPDLGLIYGASESLRGYVLRGNGCKVTLSNGELDSCEDRLVLKRARLLAHAEPLRK